MVARAHTSVGLSLVIFLLLLAGLVQSQTPPSLPPQAAAKADQDPFIQAARELRERTGRDNALIVYQEASYLAPGHTPDDATGKLLRKVVREGWSEEAQSLLPYLQQWNAAIAHVLKGVELDQAEGLGAHSGMETPVPNFLFATTASRVLSAQGRYYESLDRLDQALDRQLAALRFGSDFGSEGNAFIGVLISIAIQVTTNEVLSSMVESGDLDESQLARIAEAVAKMENSTSPFARAMTFEHQMIKQSAERMMQDARSPNPNRYRWLQERIIDMGAPRTPTQQEIIEMLESFPEEMDTYHLEIQSDARREPHELDLQDVMRSHKEMIDGFRSPFSKFAIPNFAEAKTREDVMIAGRRLLLTQIALERYRLQHERYPDSLEALRGAFLDELPTDPFSGEAFRYQVQDDGADYTMYSLGPDKLDNPEAGEYDAANGTISAGVIR